jgi:hypothetical protein
MIAEQFIRAQVTSDGMDEPADEMEIITIDEYGYSEEEDAEWEEVEE